MTKVNQDQLKKVSDEVRAILESNEMALQPLLEFSPHGIIPTVRLISTKEETQNDKGNDKEEAGGGEKEEGVTESK